MMSNAYGQPFRRKTGFQTSWIGLCMFCLAVVMSCQLKVLFGFKRLAMSVKDLAWPSTHCLTKDLYLVCKSLGLKPRQDF